jgi:hypothetical protein
MVYELLKRSSLAIEEKKKESVFDYADMNTLNDDREKRKTKIDLF